MLQEKCHVMTKSKIMIKSRKSRKQCRISWVFLQELGTNNLKVIDTNNLKVIGKGKVG